MVSSTDPSATRDPSASTALPIRPVARSTSGWRRLPVLLRRVLLLAGLILIWQLYVTLTQVSPLLVPTPLAVAGAFWQGWSSGALLGYTLQTLKVLVAGMLIGMIVAAVLTTFAIWTTVGDDLLVLFTSMLNPLPAIAVLPMAVLWFGLNETSLIFVIANAVTWPIALNVSTGFRTVNPTIMMVGRNLGLRGWRLVADVLMPSALAHIITGLKTGWAFGWRTMIAAELVFGVAGATGGLGYFINNSKVFLRIPDVFAGLVTIALIGIGLEMVFNLIERRTVIHWGMKSAV